MPKVELSRIEKTNRTGYPPPYDVQLAHRSTRKLSPALGLLDFGVSEVMLEPGAWSSQRHWHEAEDEFVVILDGEAVLVENDGQTVMRPGDLAYFPKGVANGHHFTNRSEKLCRLIAIGKPAAGIGHYPDIDLLFDGSKQQFIHRDGTPY